MNVIARFDEIPLLKTFKKKKKKNVAGGRTERRTNVWTDGQMDGQCEDSIPPPHLQTPFAVGYNKRTYHLEICYCPAFLITNQKLSRNRLHNKHGILILSLLYVNVGEDRGNRKWLVNLTVLLVQPISRK